MVTTYQRLQEVGEGRGGVSAAHHGLDGSLGACFHVPMAKKQQPVETQVIDIATEIEQWPVGKVKPYKRNAKAHPAEQVERLARLIKRHGFDQAIVVDGKGVIVKGHGRWLAAQELAMTTVPVVVRADLTPAQAAEARLADNRVAEFGWDFEMLRDDLVVAGDLPEFDIELTGFNLDDIVKQVSIEEKTKPSNKSMDNDESELEPEFEESSAKPTPGAKALATKLAKFFGECGVDYCKADVMSAALDLDAFAARAIARFSSKKKQRSL